MGDKSIPRHIGYIVDGNRRWAKRHGLPAYEGHLAGYNAIQDVARATLKSGVEYMSAYIFSTENWKRTSEEISGIMGLVLKMLTADLHKFMEDNVRIIVAGSKENVHEKILKAIDEAEEMTKNNTSGTLMLCFNYGGQLEIADAVKKIIAAGVEPDDVTPELIEQNLYSPEVPPCDLIVRTSGEQRLSNFQLWRSAYSEFIFLDKEWPDMRTGDVDEILKEYANRNRRFGGN